MDVEYTARQVKVSDSLRQQANDGVDRIARILGNPTAASVTFRAERYMQIADVTIQARYTRITAEGRANSLEIALREALDRAEHQAHRTRERSRTQKRLPLEEKLLTPAAGHATPRVRTRPHTHVDPLVISQPHKAPKATLKPTLKSAPRAVIPIHAARNTIHHTIIEPHILAATDAIEDTPMTIEMAVKEVEAGERELLIFRNPAGNLYVLHRRCDGNVEVVALPY